MNSEPFGLIDLFSRNSREFGPEPALLCEGLAPISHERLFLQIEAAIGELNSLGIGRNDRVAIVMPQGPELASVFLAIATGATAAPLNHNYKMEDFAFYLEDLSAKALILLEGDDSSARAAAAALDIQVIEVKPDPSVVGQFTLCGKPLGSTVQTGAGKPDDIALVLHTSGTTSRPKMVPLTQKNLYASCRNIIQTLNLQPSDRCLNLMPLFHIHGLVACVLASLGAGGSTVCTRKFEAVRFWSWLSEWKPTWYSAVPTMHQAILGQKHLLEELQAGHSLRFIRSSSAALPPPVMEALEDIFGVPVLESYGMTEASHQMASNPMPPAKRKPGSVGLPAGPEVCILNEAGDQLPQGEVGEIAIRGENVTEGYENNPSANEAAFTKGWFRTGDQGFLDQDGYLFITGRLKEMINRGGENVAPREIDEALLKHEEIKQAVGFAIPHPSLGEDIGVAVILEENSSLDEKAIRDFARNLLPDFKVPSRVLVLKDIPKGPTGKLQRIGLAEKLKDLLEVEFQMPETETEKAVASAFEKVLEVSPVGRIDNFFYRGGDSLRSIRALGILNERFAIEMPVSTVFEYPNVAHLAAHLDELIEQRELEELEAALANLSPEERDRLLDSDSNP